MSVTYFLGGSSFASDSIVFDIGIAARTMGNDIFQSKTDKGRSFCCDDLSNGSWTYFTYNFFCFGIFYLFYNIRLVKGSAINDSGDTSNLLDRSNWNSLSESGCGKFDITNFI